MLQGVISAMRFGVAVEESGQGSRTRSGHPKGCPVCRPAGSQVHTVTTMLGKLFNSNELREVIVR